jgi:hypothetical protein
LLSHLTPIYLQGFLLARPVPADKVLSLIATVPDQVASLLLTTPGKAISRQQGPATPPALTVELATELGRST